MFLFSRESDHYYSGDLIIQDPDTDNNHVNAYEFRNIVRPEPVETKPPPAIRAPVQTHPMPPQTTPHHTKAVSTPSLRSGGSANSLRDATSLKEANVYHSKPSLISNTTATRYPRHNNKQFLHDEVPQTQV
jgi:hypothetical protein